MRYLKLYEDHKDIDPFNEEDWDETEIEYSINDIVNWINPSDPIMSDEYHFHVFGDDDYYDNYDDYTTDDIINIIDEVCLKKDSQTSDKFGWDFLLKNKKEILNKCREVIDNDTGYV